MMGSQIIAADCKNASQQMNLLEKNWSPIHKVAAPGSPPHGCDRGRAALSSPEESEAVEPLTSFASLTNTGRDVKETWRHFYWR